MGHLTNVANSIVQSIEKGKNKAALETIFTGEYSGLSLTLQQLAAQGKQVFVMYTQYSLLHLLSFGHCYTLSSQPSSLPLLIGIGKKV